MVAQSGGIRVGVFAVWTVYREWVPEAVLPVCYSYMCTLSTFFSKMLVVDRLLSDQCGGTREGRGKVERGEKRERKRREAATSRFQLCQIQVTGVRTTD